MKTFLIRFNMMYKISKFEVIDQNSFWERLIWTRFNWIPQRLVSREFSLFKYYEWHVSKWRLPSIF